MKKEDLKPGMKVGNKISGTIGEIRGEKGCLLYCADQYVMIRRKLACGKYDYPIWNVENLEIID